MLHAERKNISPEALIAEIHQQHQQDFGDFLIEFDHYHSTHSPENKELSELIFNRCQEGGYIHKKVIEQAFDPEKSLFLPDRFIKGSCPRCQAPDQYGDNCEACGATYNPLEMSQAVSVISGAKPITKETEHLFFTLAEFGDFLQSWTHAEHLQDEVRNKLDEWFEVGLKDWDISRDAPYFGFKIPGFDDKYFYVWLDAPIGYMASFKALCDKQGLNFDDWWQADSQTELYHFIGKDIIYFHALFWPAMLHAANFRTPSAIFAHGFLTFNGKKMSKSRGTFITARHYLNHLKPEYLRYYFATRLGNRIDDIDLDVDEFRQKINADLVGKFINIASRCSGFIKKRFAGQLATSLDDADLYQQFVSQKPAITSAFEQREYASAMRQIMQLADLANQYINDKQPWVIAKQDGQDELLHKVCTQGINLFRFLLVMLKPVLPAMSEQAETFLNESPLNWDSADQPLLNHTIKPFKPLMTRIDEQQTAALLDDANQGA
jgi:methionyl-tRNA synthetase